jgi:hypothetical protein
MTRQQVITQLITAVTESNLRQSVHYMPEKIHVPKAVVKVVCAAVHGGFRQGKGYKTIAPKNPLCTGESTVNN